MKKTILQVAGFLAISSLFLMSCGPSNVNLTIDNPTNQDISITIDDKTPINLNRNTKAPLSLLEGKHTLKMGDKVQEFELKGLDIGILNPTGSYYINEKIKYATSISLGGDESDAKSEEFMMNIIADDLDAIKTSNKWGNYELFNSLVIPRDWDFDLDKIASTEVKTKSNSETRHKIHRYIDLRNKLIEEVRDEMNKEGEKKYSKEEVIMSIKLVKMMNGLKDTTATNKIGAEK
jgi:hypothetical protein